MFNFKKLYSYNYLFSIDRVILTRSDMLFGLLGLILLVIAVIMKIAARLAPSPVDKAYREKAYTLALSIGALEVVWFGARYQAIRFFGSHFVALGILIIGLIWLVYLVKDIVKYYRPAKEKWEKEQLKQKYLK